MLANWNGNVDGHGELRFSQIIGSPLTATRATDTILEVNGSIWASTVTPFNLAPQAGATNKFYLTDANLRASLQKNGIIHAAHTIFIPSTNPARSVIQYFVIRPNGSFTRQTIDDGSSFYGFPNLAVNDFGDVLLGYAKFSTNTYPSAAFRVKYYNRGTFSSEVIFAEGEAAYPAAPDNFGRIRWGDYTAASVDPINGRDFWTFGQYSKLTNLIAYSTRWANVRLFSPTNDSFSTAVNLSGSALTNTVITERLTKEIGEPLHLQTNYVSAWFNWVAPAAGQVSISSGDIDTATALAVYTGTSVSNLTFVTQSSLASPQNAERKLTANAVFSATSSTIYRIAVLVHSGESQSTSLRVNQQVAPLFVQHPSPATNEIIEGYSINLTGFAIGNPVPAYQWKKNGVNISGATATNYTIVNMTSAYEGLYTLTASNSNGTATSNGSYLKYFGSGATPLENGVWTNGVFQFTIHNVVGYTYVIHGSTNMITWTPLKTNVVPFTFADEATTNFPLRFYRSEFIP